MTDDTCGHPTQGGDGPPCQNPATEGDHCWLKAHGGNATNGRKRESAPSKAQEEQIAAVIEGGGSIREACRKAGVHHEQMYRWLEYGHDEPESVWGDFRERFVRARGEREGMYRQALIDIAKETNDTATLMAMLKQREPESWGDVDRGEQSGGEIQVFTQAPTKEELEQLLKPNGDDD